MASVVGIYSPAPRSGKSTLAAALQGHNFVREAFAGPLKVMLAGLLAARGVERETIDRMLDGDLKEEPSPLLSGRSPRYALQRLGTEWGRELMAPDIWLDHWTARAKRHLGEGRNVVVDDMRFPNEAAAVRKLGGVLVCVIRPGRDHDGGHASEGALDSTPFDLVLTNNDSHAIAFAMRGSAAVARVIAERAAA